MSGEINIITTGLNPPLLTGNIFSVGISTILVVAISYIFPDKTPFQWEAFKEKITTTEANVSASDKPQRKGFTCSEALHIPSRINCFQGFYMVRELPMRIVTWHNAKMCQWVMLFHCAYNTFANQCLLLTNLQRCSLVMLRPSARASVKLPR